MATSTHRSSHEVLIASNRGPVSYSRSPGGALTGTRGGGGLVTALTGVLQASGGLWMAAAMSDGDRQQAERGRFPSDVEGGGYDLRYLDVEPERYDRYYNGVSNRLLWFAHHSLWDIPRTPVFDEETFRDWDAYTHVNRAFAQALAEEGESGSDEPFFLVQDYHLSLVPAMLRGLRPGARISHFHHTPFAGPGYFGILPARIRGDVLTGLLGADVLGFHSARWAEHFLLCCRGFPGARVDLRRRVVRWEDREVQVRVYPISIDVAALEARAAEPEVAEAGRRLREDLGNRRLVLRVDRAELSKNVLRGFLAYEDLLRLRPEWRGRVRFLALLNPSREGVPEYRDYVEACEQEARRINAELGDADWRPVDLRLKDDLTGVLAAFGRYDVLVVNPVVDGLNLVAKEGPILNRSQGVLILSENAGAVDELGRHALVVNPFDVRATAEAMAAALDMPMPERRWRAAGLRRAIRHTTLERWVGRQLEDLERAGPKAPQS